MLGKAIWRLRIQENPLAAGSPPEPRWGSLQHSRKPPSWWEGLAVPSPRTLSPALGPSDLASPTPTPKLVPTPLCVEHITFQISHFNFNFQLALLLFSSSHHLLVLSIHKSSAQLMGPLVIARASSSMFRALTLCALQIIVFYDLW